MNKDEKLNLMLDSIFKAVTRREEARGMVASVISLVNDIKKRIL